MKGVKPVIGQQCGYVMSIGGETYQMPCIIERVNYLIPSIGSVSTNNDVWSVAGTFVLTEDYGDWPQGTAIGFQDKDYKGSTGLVYEIPPGPPY